MERILIVEDSPTQREMLRHTLEEAGYTVFGANDGAEAWKQLATIRPTLVLTDILMPNMDGYALCRAIKAEPAHRAAPVVLLTSLSDPRDVVAALECGADGFIGKPFENDYLLSRVRAIISNRDLPNRERDDRGVEISHDGKTFLINAERRQVLDLLLSVYEVAMLRNADLAKAQASLRQLNAELERKVQDRTRRLQESNQALETFCYSVAHDLRAPLRGIQGYVTMLSEDLAPKLDDEARAYFDRVRASAARMDRMILDLLAYGRVSNADAKLEPVDLAVEVRRLVAELADEVARTRAVIEVKAEASLPFVTSRVLLQQIVSNLLNNALKFVREGEPPHVTITAGLTRTGAFLEIRDRGIGFDLKYREKIFKVFERLHQGTYDGTGIGLAIVRKAVERLGGDVQIESEPGQGSSFTIRLPQP